MAKRRDSVPEMSVGVVVVLLAALVVLGLPCTHRLIHHTRDFGPQACSAVIGGGLLLLTIGLWVRRKLALMDEPELRLQEVDLLPDNERAAAERRLWANRDTRAHIRADRTWASLVIISGALIAAYAVFALLLSRLHTS